MKTTADPRPPRPDQALAVAVAAAEQAAPVSFRDLQVRVRGKGLMRSRPGYYICKIASTLLLLTAGWVAFVLVGDSWWQLAVAGFLGFAYVQVGFIGHDAGHLQIFRGKRASEVVGYIHGDLLLGFSYGWWVNHHNRHHSHPNHLSEDPDIVRRRAIFTAEQGDVPMSRFRRWVVRNQGAVFFPLLALESLGLRVISIQVLRQRSVPRVRLEAALIALHFAGYATALILVLSPLKILVFVLIQQAVFGLYSGAVFAPNHKGLPVRSEERLDWVHRQILTSRNIRSNWLVNFLYGGLNYQIEHHLFPTMPRPNLRKARPIVQTYCEEQGIPYYEVGLLGSYREIIRHLSETSAEWSERRTRTSTT